MEMTELQEHIIKILLDKYGIRIEQVSFISLDSKRMYQAWAKQSLRPDRMILITKCYRSAWLTNWDIIIQSFKYIYDRRRGL